MSNEGFYKTTPVSKMIGISTQSVNVWANLYLPSIKKTDSGHNLYSDADIEVLKKVKKLIDKGHRHSDIQEMLIVKEKKEQIIKNDDIQAPEVKNNDPETKFNGFASIPEFIYKTMDFKSIITNDDLKYLFNRIAELEQENKRLQACK